jgi:Tol biopolymer transport system component
MSNQQLVASLENIFVAQSIHNDIFPMPHWSPDGSQFVFQGLVRFSDHVERELFQVSRDGQAEQVTHLSSFANILDTNYSWSPDGGHIAFFLATKQIRYPEALVATIDMSTMMVTNYCMPILYGGEGYGMGGQPASPVWSPDGKQFLVVDWYEKDHYRVILVDVVLGLAAQIAEDMEPVGWMISP